MHNNVSQSTSGPINSIGMASVPIPMSPAELVFDNALKGLTKTGGGGNIDYLQKKCREFGISPRGTRAVLVAQLQKHRKHLREKDSTPVRKGSSPAGKDSTPAGNTFDQRKTEEYLAEERVLAMLGNNFQFCVKKKEMHQKITEIDQQIIEMHQQTTIKKVKVFDTEKRLSDDKKDHANGVIEESISLLNSGQITDPAKIDGLKQEIENLQFNTATGRLKSASALFDLNGQPPQDTQPSPPTPTPQPAKPTPSTPKKTTVREVLSRHPNSDVVDNLSNSGINNTCLDHLVKNHFMQISLKVSDFYKKKHRRRPDKIQVDHEKFVEVNVYGPKDYPLIIDAVKFVYNSHRGV